MSYTMPMPIASSDFQGSCPARPGTTNASARPASHAGAGGRVRRGGMPRRLSGFLLGVAALELLNAARSVDELVLAGVEGVRFRGHLDLHQRVFLAVLPLHRLAALGVDGRARQESVVRAGIEKDHRPVVGVDACLHGRAPAEKVANYKGKPKNRALTPIFPDSYPRRIESKNSALVLVALSLSMRNSAASSSSIGNSSFLSTHTFCRIGCSISNSSSLVPDRFTLMSV